MQQRWWLMAVAVIGVVLAVFLIPRPDTGEDIPEPAPVAKPTKAREVIPGPPPGAEKLIAERNRPSAKASKKLSAPWGGIRRKLRAVTTDEAKELSTQIRAVQQKFADVPSDITSDVDAIIAEAVPLIATLKADHMGDADIKTLVAAYEQAVSDWQNNVDEKEK